MTDTHRAAALTVVRHAHGTTDARELLEALGLIDGPDGRALLPVPAVVLPLGDVGPSAGAAEPQSRHTDSAGDLRRPAVSTAPPGLLAAATSLSPPPRPDLTSLPPREDPMPAPAPVIDGVDGLTTAPAPDGPYVAVLRIDDLFVDHSYQRPLDAARVKRIAAAWSPRLVGLIDVSDRGTGTGPVNRYAIVNGQHRTAAAARAGVTHMACNIHEGLDVPTEAKLMAELDRTTKKLSGHDQWRARRGGGDPTVVAVERIAAAHGLRVEPQLADGVLRAYGAAEKLLTQGGEQLLDNTLAVIRGAYGMTAAAWQAPLVSGVGQLLRTHPGIDIDRLTRALADTSPTQLRAHATTAREIDGGTLADSVTRVLAGLHNKTTGPGPRITGSTR